MSRLVELDAKGPRKLNLTDFDDEKGNVAICQCGLSAEFPFCDGSHRRTAGEDPEVCYRYEDGDGKDTGRRPIEGIRYADEEESK